MRALINLLTFWILALFFLMLALQTVGGGSEMLDGASAPQMTGWLFHFGLAALTLEALLRRLSRILLILPVLFYGGYYLAYWRQAAHIASETELVSRSPPSKILDFSSDKHSLITDGADAFVSTHVVPVAYAYDPSYQPEQYLAYRLVPADTVWPLIGAMQKSLQVLAVYVTDEKQPNVRVVRAPEKPKGALVTVAINNTRDVSWRGWNIGYRITEVSLDGTVVGSYKAPFVDRLPLFPLLSIGCATNAGSSRTCDANFVLRREDIKGAATPEDAVGLMLGLSKLTDADYKDLRRPDLLQTSTPRAPEGQALPTDDAFAMLQSVLDARNYTVSWNAGSDVSRDPRRLAPMAESIVHRFVKLAEADAANIPHRQAQISLLAEALAALPAAEFEAHASALAPILRSEGAWQTYPALYVRLADAAPTLFPFYRDRLLHHNASRIEEILAALAICRLGQADGELIAALKARWTDSDDATALGEDYRSALFIALLKLKQLDYLRRANRAGSKLLLSWYQSLLAGHGQTAVGPNNCMPMEWPLPMRLPPNLAPKLSWKRHQWSEEAK